jgi:putative ABC transport system permease protein
LICDGIAIVSDLTFASLTRQRAMNGVQLGLVRFAPGADPAEVRARLRERLPEETLVWSPEELKAHEQHFFLRVKPVGFMFTSGLYVALIVGAVILYQVLSADISKHLRQYATLKAMGYGATYLRGVVMTQGLLLGVLAYLPALVLGQVLYIVVARMTDLPMYMTLAKVLLVFGLSAGMCMAAGLLAIRKVNSADPADLF